MRFPDKVPMCQKRDYQRMPSSILSKRGGTRPPSAREVNSRASPPAVGRFATSGLPSLFPRLIEMILRSLPNGLPT